MANQLAEDAAVQNAVGVSEDRRLVIAFQSGKPGAGESIHQYYSPMVQSICARLLYDPEDVQEAVQETFLRTLRALPRFNGSYQLGAWIARIARNVCLDQIRFQTKRSRRTNGFENVEESSQPDFEDDPQELFLKKVEGRRVYDTLAALPSMYRSAIILRDMHGLAYSDIATVLSVSEYQVKNFLHRGRKTFRRLWSSTGAAAFVTLPARIYNRVAEKCLRLAAGSDPSVKNGVPSPSVVTRVEAASTRVAQLFEGGNVIVERVAGTVTAALVGLGAAGCVPAAASPVPEQVREAGVHQTAEALSESGGRDLMTSTGEIYVGDTGEAQPEGVPTDQSVNVPTDEQSATDASQVSEECYPASSEEEEDEESEEAEVSGTEDPAASESDGTDCAESSAAEPEDDAAAEPEDDAAAEPEDDAAAGPEGDASAGPEGDASAGPEDDAAAGPEGDASAEPEDDAAAEKEVSNDSED